MYIAIIISNKDTTYQVWKQILVWVLRLWLEQNLEVSVPLLISEEKERH